MASNTPNLNLLKKDPVTDGNDTFNIETMLNENWDKIDAAVGQLEEDMQEIDIPLSDATNGTRSTVAASEKAVGFVMQTANAANLAAATAQTRADQAFQLGNERKQEVVDALIALGVTASMADSWDTLISKMSAIIKATGNATAADVLAGKTFSNASGAITGTIPNRGAGGIVTPGTVDQLKASGYYSSPITVLGDAHLVPDNIRSGVDVYGVSGALKASFSGSIHVNVGVNSGPNKPTQDIPIVTFPLGTKWFKYVPDNDKYSYVGRYYNEQVVLIGYLTAEGAFSIGAATDITQTQLYINLMTLAGNTWFTYGGANDYRVTTIRDDIDPLRLVFRVTNNINSSWTGRNLGNISGTFYYGG